MNKIPSKDLETLKKLHRNNLTGSSIVVLNVEEFDDLMKVIIRMQDRIDTMSDKIMDLEDKLKNAQQTINIQMEKPKAHYATSEKEKKFQTAEKPSRFSSFI